VFGYVSSPNPYEGERQVREEALSERLAMSQSGNARRRRRPSMAEQRLTRGPSDPARTELPELFGHPVFR
jgi:hypothetical protein